MASLSGRLGLATLSGEVQAAGARPAASDWNQIVRLSAAVRRVVCRQLGGPGLYAGGASAVGQLASGGTAYPAATLVIEDDAGFPWPKQTTAAQAIEGLGVGGNRLYAVIATLPGRAPDAGDGRLSGVRFVVAATAPAHSLRLADVTVSGGAITALTPVAAPTPRRPVGVGFTPPSGGEPGAEWLDQAGGLWQFMTEWQQVRTAVVAPGEVAALEALAPPAEYRLRVAGEVDTWRWLTSVSRWASVWDWQYGHPVTAAYSVTANSGRTLYLDPGYDWLFERLGGVVRALTGTWDASNRWDVNIRGWLDGMAGSSIVPLSASVTTAEWSTPMVTPSPPVIFSAPGATGHRWLDWRFERVGSPGNLQIHTMTADLRRVRPL